MKRIIFILIWLLAASQAASFNCSLAKTVIDQMICASPEISKADENIADLYKNIKKQSKLPDELTNNQFAWLKERNSCKTDLCILEKYKSRENELNSWLQKEAKELENCTDRPECWPEGSAMNTGLALAADLQKSASQLKKKHDELIKLLSNSPSYNGAKEPDSRVISALLAQEISWQKYSSDECELIGSLTGAGGSWPSTYATECEVNLTGTRLQRVNSAIKCIQKTPLKDRWMEQAGCLQQLAPLVNKL